MSEKRKRESDDVEKPVCKYGEKCYRKNPIHLVEYLHPHKGEEDGRKRMKLDETEVEQDNEQFNSPGALRTVPYFLTKVCSIPQRFNSHTMSIGLKDILSLKMGDLQSSVQFNYMFDIPWLMKHYPIEKRSSPLLIVHGDQREKKQQLHLDAQPFPNVKLFQANLPIQYGTHHSKMMLLLYTQGMRVVVTTANLIREDWEKKTQGVWISPLYPKISDTNYEKTESQFQKDLMDYLDHYGPGPLTEWKKDISEHDMSKTSVRLVASVPGRHVGEDKDKWGHLKLRKILKENGSDLDDINTWPVIGQFSSIGSLGRDESSWLCSEWLRSLSTNGETKTSLPNPPLHLIFPTAENVRTSLEGYMAGASLPYSCATAARQPYLKNFFCRWKSDVNGRTRASPHLKSYTRISRDESKAAWFLLTSANLSKAAWGGLEKNGNQLMIRSYEIGVLFLPKDEDPSLKYFRLRHDQSDTSDVMLRLPFDVPVVPYSSQDEPWLWDKQYDEADVHGHTWRC